MAVSEANSGMSKRDYDLMGASGREAVETGLAAAEWYHTDVPRKAMKELMQRSDGPAIRDTIIWLGSMLVFAAGGIWFWGTWWCVPFFLAYGVLYGSSGDSRWHEAGHGTAFKTRWMNDVVYQIASFMIMRNPATWRWSHARHHTDTVIVGRDPEIAVMRPPDLARVAINFFGVLDVWHGMSDLLRNAAGILSPAEKSFIPEQERYKVVRAARVHLAIYAATIALGACPRFVAAADADRPAAFLRRVARHPHRPFAARRARRQCDRPPAEFAHGADEPDQPLHLLEHELPRRTPHVPDGALSRAAQAARD